MQPLWTGHLPPEGIKSDPEVENHCSRTVGITNIAPSLPIKQWSNLQSHHDVLLQLHSLLPIHLIENNIYQICCAMPYFYTCFLSVFTEYNNASFVTVITIYTTFIGTTWEHNTIACTKWSYKSLDKPHSHYTNSCTLWLP